MIQTESTEKYRTSAACDSIVVQQSVFSGAVSASGKMANLLNTEPQTQIGIERQIQSRISVLRFMGRGLM